MENLAQYLQLAVPLLLILWLALWPLRGRARWAHLAMTGVLVGLIALWGQWRWPSAYAPYVLGLLFLGAAVFGRRRSNGRRDSRMLPGFLATLIAMVAAFGLALGVEARLRPADLTDLALPAAGRFAVTQGGNHRLLNTHLVVNDADTPSLTGWRGQAYAIDLQPIDRFGRPLMNGLPVTAPCAGSIAGQGEDTRLGRYLILDCAGTWVVLSGLDSIAATGPLAVGSLVGQGNRITLHAQTPGTATHPFSGEPLWISLNGTYPVRSAILGF
jgi:hypothetical protein